MLWKTLIIVDNVYKGYSFSKRRDQYQSTSDNPETTYKN